MADAMLIGANLRRSKVRLALMLFSLFVAFLVYGVLITFSDFALSGGTPPSTYRMVTSNKINYTQPVPIAYWNYVAKLPGVKVATHSLWFGGYYREPKNSFVSFAADMPSFLDAYSELIIPDEQRRNCLADRTGLLVGKAVAAQYGWAVGQSVTLQSGVLQKNDGSSAWPFKICGLITDKSATGGENAVLMHYSYINESLAFGRDTTQMITFVPAAKELSAGLRQTIDSHFANSAAQTDTITEQELASAFAAQLGNIGLIVRLVVGIAFVTILMIVGATMALSVRERTRELGILKAIGFPSSRIMRLVIGESLMIATIGGAAGLLAAQVLTSFAASLGGKFAGLAMQPQTWLSGFLYIALLGLITAAVPAYAAVRLKTVVALGRT